MSEKRHGGWQLAWVLFGLGLVLLSGPIGDWYDYLNQLWSGSTSLDGHKFESSLGLDRAPGWLTLIAGWWCVARGLGGSRKPPSDLLARFGRIRFRLRWLPVPILGTLGTYVALAYHHASPLVLIIDVENAPPGATVQGGATVGRYARHWSRYGATFDYLFGFNLPPDQKVSFFDRPASAYRFGPSRLSIQNWQPYVQSVFVGIEDQAQDNAAFLLLRIDPDIRHTEPIRVTHQSLQECQSPDYTKGGACLIQISPPAGGPSRV